MGRRPHDLLRDLPRYCQFRKECDVSLSRPSPGPSRVGGRGHCSVTLDVVIAVQSLCSGLASQHSGQAPCDQNCE